MGGKIIFLMTTALFACGGCATQQVWSNPEKTQQQFYQDLARCKAMANSAGSQQIATAYPGPTTGTAYNPAASFSQGWNMGNAMNVSAERESIFGNCMMGEGWYLEDAK